MTSRPMSRTALLCVIAAAIGLLAPHVAAPGEYRIGVEDVLGVSVWDNKDADQVVFVRPDGRISLPLLGDVDVAGLTVSELATRLNELYRRTIHGAQVSVTVREIRSRAIYFVGGVGKPGPMQLMQDLTVLQAISLAGGVAPTADLEAAFVVRGEQQLPVNLVRLLHRGDMKQNMTLRPGDTVVVPVADLVYVQGEVKNPGAVKATSELTILRAITQAGGLSPLAASGRVTVLRDKGRKREHIKVDVDRIMSSPDSAADLPLYPNDIVIVPQRMF